MQVNAPRVEAWHALQAAADADPPRHAPLLDQLPYALVRPETARAALRIESAAALLMAQKSGVQTP
jgi:hypothetical protein